MSEHERRKPFWFLTDYTEGEGNIWGWKFSIYGGIFIAILLTIAIYRHITMDVPFSYDPKAEQAMEHPLQQRAKENAAADTLKLDH